MRFLGSLTTLRPLRQRNFRLLFLGTVLSHTGDFMQVMAQSWLVWELTRSAFLLGLVGFCQAAPRLFLGAVGGVVADRMDRRRLLLHTQTLAMVQAFVFWALVYFGAIQFWHILVLVVFLGAVNSLNQTARQSLLHHLVPREELLGAVALNASVVSLTKIIGPSLAGVLISVIGVAGCLFVNGLSFLAIIVSLTLMDLPQWRRHEPAEGLWREVGEGYRYTRTHPRVFAVLFLAYVVALVGAPYSRFLPVFASDILHVGASGFGLLLAAPGLGAMASGLVLASVGNLRVRRNYLFLSVLGFALFLLLFAFSRMMVVSLFCLTVVGFAQMSFRSLANTAIQLETPPHLLGRVLSLFFMDKGLWSFGTLFIGGLASWVGTPWAVGSSALCCAAAAIYFRRQAPVMGRQLAETADDSALSMRRDSPRSGGMF